MYTVKKVIQGKEVEVKLEQLIQVSAFLTEGFELVEENQEQPIEQQIEKTVNKGGRPKKS